MGQRPMRIVNGQPHDDYFVQKMVVEDARHLSRLELFDEAGTPAEAGVGEVMDAQEGVW